MKKNLFNNSYCKLGDNFYARTSPLPVADPDLIVFNHDLSNELGLSDSCFNSADATAIFAGNLVPEGAEPVAMTYAGHQFGHFNPQLGDGRAVLLAQFISDHDSSFDIHLKGSGRTAFSRDGDGRSALGPVLREYLLCEAMAKLGVPTTRALAAVTTGEKVARQQLLPGGVITRIASSFVRVGTFQFFSAKDDVESITKLADYIIEYNYPQVRDEKNPYVALFEAIINRQAALIAQWMQYGFIHGVMNTDNMSIAGETIDYGPCAFMDFYAHDQVYSSIDRQGRYAYSNQPSIGLWNLTRLAESLLPLLADDTEAAVEIAKNKLEQYIVLYQGFWLDGMRQKTGLSTVLDGEVNHDKALIHELLDIMANNNADFTLTFHYLSQCLVDNPGSDKEVRALFDNPEQFDLWAQKWRRRLCSEASEDNERQLTMQSVNPVFIPRNHQIETAIRAAEDHNDFSVFHALHEVLQFPYQQQPGKEVYMLPPEPGQVVEQTFCGT